MDVELLHSANYRTFLHSQIKKIGKRGVKASLAKAADCQQSRMTQILNGTAHLNEDQALGVCRYLNLTETESDYFILLVRCERAQSKTLRDYLNTKVMKIKDEISDQTLLTS